MRLSSVADWDFDFVCLMPAFIVFTLFAEVAVELAIRNLSIADGS